MEPLGSLFFLFLVDVENNKACDWMTNFWNTNIPVKNQVINKKKEQLQFLVIGSIQIKNSNSNHGKNTNVFSLNLFQMILVDINIKSETSKTFKLFLEKRLVAKIER